MTQKKKLVLGPLPDQADDYSHYEESVIHWPRIIAALFVLALVVVLGVQVFWDDDDTRVQTSATPVVSDAHTQEIKADEQPTASISPQEPVQKDIKQTETPPQEKDNDKVEVLAKPETLAKKEVPPKAITRVKAKAIDIRITNSAISRAVFTLDIKDREPVSVLESYELTLPEAGIFKVLLFTEMKGLRGKKLYHDWYLNGVRQARVSIPVNVTHQRSHSSKYINTQMLGDWTVKVVDTHSNEYVNAGFRVVKP